MKKHPLDDFFAERLSENEIAPSQRARDMFQKRLAERDKKASPFLGIRPKTWYYYGAAASVALLMTIGYLQFGYDKVQNGTPVVARVQTDKPVIKDTSSASDKNQGIPEAGPELKDPESQAVVKPEINRMVAAKKPETSPAQVENKSSVVEQVKITETNPAPKDQLAMAVEETGKIAETPVTGKGPAGIFKNADGETIVLITSIPQDEKAGLPGNKPILKMSENMALTNADQEEKSVFLRVFGEIKNLKHGEKVDFSKLGLKRSDSANEEGFIASETKQIRQGWQWIKGKINNN